MKVDKQNLVNHQMEITLGNLLRAGVLLAGAVVLIGGILYLFSNGHQVPHYRIFRGEPADLKSVAGIIKQLSSLHSRAIIQLGFLLLIATPVARVAMSVFGFARKKDWTYVVITAIVLLILLFSLSGATNL